VQASKCVRLCRLSSSGGEFTNWKGCVDRGKRAHRAWLVSAFRYEASPGSIIHLRLQVVLNKCRGRGYFVLPQCLASGAGSQLRSSALREHTRARTGISRPFTCKLWVIFSEYERNCRLMKDFSPLVNVILAEKIEIFCSRSSKGKPSRHSLHVQPFCTPIKDLTGLCG
jgi:hypothetical protein